MSVDTPQQLVGWWRALAADNREMAERFSHDLTYCSTVHDLTREATTYERCATHLERVIAGKPAVPSYE